MKKCILLFIIFLFSTIINCQDYRSDIDSIVKNVIFEKLIKCCSSADIENIINEKIDLDSVIESNMYNYDNDYFRDNNKKCYRIIRVYLDDSAKYYFNHAVLRAFLSVELMTNNLYYYFKSYIKGKTYSIKPFLDSIVSYSDKTYRKNIEVVSYYNSQNKLPKSIDEALKMLDTLSGMNFIYDPSISDLENIGKLYKLNEKLLIDFFKLDRLNDLTLYFKRYNLEYDFDIAYILIHSYYHLKIYSKYELFDLINKSVNNFTETQEANNEYFKEIIEDMRNRIKK